MLETLEMEIAFESIEIRFEFVEGSWREVLYNTNELKIVNHVGINNSIPSTIMDLILKTTIGYSLRRGIGKNHQQTKQKKSHKNASKGRA